MRKLALVLGGLLGFCVVLSAQFTGKDMTVRLSTSLNYYPAVNPYFFESQFTQDNERLLLEFRSATTGFFEIVEGEPITVMQETTVEPPSQLLSVGASVQIMNPNMLFHEIALTKFSFSKSAHTVDFLTPDTLGNLLRFRISGYNQNTAAFAFRYEIGKYFGDNRKSKLRFGLSGGIEPSFYFYRRVPHSSAGFPTTVRLFTIEVSAIPMISAKLSKKLTLDFKVIPNILLADYQRVRIENPLLTQEQQDGYRNYDPPNFNVGINVSLRYSIKEPDARSRSRRRRP